MNFKENKRNIAYLEYTFYGAETWALGKVDRKYLVSFKVVLKKEDGQLDRSCEK
jgi:hypothetical protein